MDKEKYQEVILKSSLDKDLQNLPFGEFQLVMVTIQYNLCCSYFEASFNVQFFLCFAVSRTRPAP
jgi:hypothetical protein